MTAWLYTWYLNLSLLSDATLTLPSIVLRAKTWCDGYFLPAVLCGYCIFWSLVHSVYGFVDLFHANFTVLVFCGFYGCLRFSKLSRNPTLWRMSCVYTGLVCVGFLTWAADSLMCQTDWRQMSMSPQLHAWWHVIIGASCFQSVAVGAACRQWADVQAQGCHHGADDKLQEQGLGRDEEYPRLAFTLGVIPVILETKLHEV
jgi:hypothetical protein